MAITLGAHYNDLDLPGLVLSEDMNEISFDWKEFLNRFYKEESNVQRMKQFLRLGD